MLAAVTEAVPVSSMKSNWVEAALKFHMPLIVSFFDLEAGPLSQSSLTYVSEAVWVKLNEPASKEIDP